MSIELVFKSPVTRSSEWGVITSGAITPHASPPRQGGSFPGPGDEGALSWSTQPTSDRRIAGAVHGKFATAFRAQPKTPPSTREGKQGELPRPARVQPSPASYPDY